MGGIVRKIWKQDPSTDICFLYTTAELEFPTNMKGCHWLSARVSERIADYYGIPSVSMNFAVAKLAKENKLILKGDRDKYYGDRIIFSNDGVHPTNEGHQIYAQAVIKAFKEMAEMKAEPRKRPGEPLNINNYERAGMSPIRQYMLRGNWQQLGQGDYVFDQLQTELILGKTVNEQIIIKFKGTRIGFFDVIGPGTGNLTVRIDNNPPMIIRCFDRYCRYYLKHYFWLPEIEDGEHLVSLTVNPAPIDKEALLPAELTGEVRKDLANMDIYLSKVMVVGELLPIEEKK
jgi:hypothetical protein